MTGQGTGSWAPEALEAVRAPPRAADICTHTAARVPARATTAAQVGKALGLVVAAGTAMVTVMATATEAESQGCTLVGILRRSGRDSS